MVDLLPAQQRVGEEHWYRGTADAIFQNLDIIRSSRPEYIVILAGDHIYKMDYSLMLKDHVESGKGCTVGCIEVPRAEASAFGVMAVRDDRSVSSFVEKPADPPAQPQYGHYAPKASQWAQKRSCSAHYPVWPMPLAPCYRHDSIPA